MSEKKLIEIYLRAVRADLSECDYNRESSEIRIGSTIPDNIIFLAHAKQDILSLLDEIEKLRQNKS